MQLYIVVKIAQEESPTGIIQRVDAWTHGVYANAAEAAGVAAKYNGTVIEVTRDAEARTLLTRWVNPGYAQP